MKLRLLVIISLLILFGQNSFADETSHRKAVEELFILMGIPKMMDSTKIQTEQMIFQQIKQQGIPDTKKPIIDKYMSKIVDLITDTMIWDKLKSEISDLYVTNFTETEVNDMLAFYKSSTGKKFIEKMPVIIKSSMEIAQRQSQSIMTEINKLLEEMKKEIDQE